VIATPDGGTGDGAGPMVTAIVVVPPDPTILVGCQQPMTASADNADGSMTDVSAIATWSAAVPFIASIGSGGVVSCVGPGTTTISASYGGLTGQTTATCAEPAVISVNVTPSTATIDAGGTLQYGASALYSSTQQCNVTRAAFWVSSVPAVASMVTDEPVGDPDAGIATGLEAGTTQIRAFFGGQTGNASLTVQ
jgi:hypothetical protein